MRRQSRLTRQYWEHVSDPARDFIRQALTIDQKKRMSAKQALEHPWLQADLKTHPSGEGKDLLPNMRANFDARRTLRKAIWSVRWANAVQKDSHANAEEKVRGRGLVVAERAQKIRNEAEDYKRDANEVRVATSLPRKMLGCPRSAIEPVRCAQPQLTPLPGGHRARAERARVTRRSSLVACNVQDSS